MLRLETEAKVFAEERREEARHAGGLAAASLVCGFDLDGALQAAPGQQARLVGRLRRAIERERLKGLRRHWSYDLNRHIALKQALDRLLGAAAAAALPAAGAAKENGARRRRR